MKRDQFTLNREAGREATLAALRDGRKVRAVNMGNKKRKASREACRRGKWEA